MNQTQRRTLTMLYSVETYLNEADISNPIPTNTNVARRRLDKVLAQLDAQLAELATATLDMRTATQHQAACERRLYWRYLLPLNRVARSEIANPLDLVPFRMPGQNTSVERLAHVARGMATAAARHAGDFIAAGLSLDFIERLERATERMCDSVRARALEGMRRCNATAHISVLIAEARKLVDLIDDSVTASCTGNPAELTRWIATRRLPSTDGRKPAIT